MPRKEKLGTMTSIMAKKSALGREPYKGTRDFYPEDWAFQKYLFDTLRKVAESYGYVEYNASPLEPAELYAAKTGEEIVNEQTYTFTDRGDRKVTLRPEMTPTVARMIAARKRELASPLRWYSIANIFRYEQPQRGRLREHYQLNVDLFGIKGIEAEVEIISLAYDIMKALGAEDHDFEIRINSRKLLQEKIKKVLKSEEGLASVMRLLDKKDRMSEREFDQKWKEVANAPLGEIDASSDVSELLGNLEKNGVNNADFSPTLVRGFDYYTDIVFEVFDKSPENNRSIFGGGRYDELLNIFDEEAVPAVGFGMGDVTTHDFLETHNLLPAYKSPVQLYICALSEENEKIAEFVNETAAALRAAGINVAIDWTYRKVGDQIKSADKQKIPFVIIIGENETQKNRVSVKELKSGQETEMPVSEVADFISKQKS